jgi:hypothetical protein
MTFARCARCGLAMPIRALYHHVRVNGTGYRTCSKVCATSFAKMFAAVPLAPAAPGVFASHANTDFGPAARALDSIAVAARAVINTRTLATRTAHIGRPRWQQGLSSAALTRLTYCGNNPGQRSQCEVERCLCCEGRGVAIRCDSCNGTGVWVIHTEREAVQGHVPRTQRCEICAGRGYVPVTDALLAQKGFTR